MIVEYLIQDNPLGTKYCDQAVQRGKKVKRIQSTTLLA